MRDARRVVKGVVIGGQLCGGGGAFRGDVDDATGAMRIAANADDAMIADHRASAVAWCFVRPRSRVRMTLMMRVDFMKRLFF